MTQLKHRYRLTQMNLIPKFGGNQAPGGRAGEVVNATVPKTISAKAVGQSGAAVTPTGNSGAGARLWKPFAALGSWFSLRTEPRGVRLAPMSGRRLVQPELRLDAVRPVRNDLSDCDFEVREIRSVMKAPSARETGLLATAGSVMDRAKSLIR